ncbi:MAG: cadmium-translocating P-type ATPase [Desulfobacteraceae bacterium]|nr:cadmium-translocating P-type ATPase [Desulfobacteraceae bacterium]
MRPPEIPEWYRAAARSATVMNDPSGTCHLCTLPLRPGDPTLQTEQGTYTFCCMGCRMVFTMLLEAEGESDPSRFRETDLFRRCQEMGIIPTDARPAPDNRSSFTVAESEGSTSTEIEESSLPLSFSVGGMWCPACAWVVSEVLEKQSGVVEARCDFATDRVRGRYDPVRTSPQQLMQTVEALGYTASEDAEQARKHARQQEFARFAVSAFLTANVMMLSFALYTGFFTFLPSESILSISIPMAVMAAGVFFYGGWNIHRRGWIGIVHGAPGMESLISLGATSAFGFSLYGLLTASVHQYFDTTAMLITLTLLGKMLEDRAKESVHRSLGSFFALRPNKARLCSARWPQGRYVSAEKIQPGDCIAVDDGDVIPVDGVVMDNRVAVDESAVTGESLPVYRDPGDRVVSGSRAFGSRVLLRAERVGADSTLERMIAVMERALEQKTDVESKTDRILRWFVPTVTGIAVLSGSAGWLFFHLAPPEALIRTVTVMVIACPCALGIAVPLARVAGISIAARNGILVQNFSAFDTAERVEAVVFDKTGTLTHGRWELTKIRAQPGFTVEQVLSWAAALETDSRHPVGVAITRYAAERGIVPAAFHTVETFDNGVRGLTGSQEIRIGTAAHAGVDDRIFFRDAESTAGVHSRVYMAVDGHPAAVLVFGDAIRDSAGAALSLLRKRGMELHLVSGDERVTTESVARTLNIAMASGECLPEQKAEYVQRLRSKGKIVTMIGDGINDAAALAQADLAAAVHSRSALGGEASDITLMQGDPKQFPLFLLLAETIRRKIGQNLACSLVYNVLAIPVAVSGLLTPLVAVCAMLLSSLTVIGNTLLLTKEWTAGQKEGDGPV